MAIRAKAVDWVLKPDSSCKDRDTALACSKASAVRFSKTSVSRAIASSRRGEPYSVMAFVEEWDGVLNINSFAASGLPVKAYAAANLHRACADSLSCSFMRFIAPGSGAPAKASV